MVKYNSVLIIGELVENQLGSITKEILGGGRQLADELNEELVCVLVGSELGDAPQLLIDLGADKVYTVENPLLEDYQTDPYVDLMEKIVNDVSPRIILMGQTSIGRDLAPRLAFRLRVSLSMDCLELNVNPENKMLEQTRAVYGGNARAIFTSKDYPQMVTVRQKAMSPSEQNKSKKGEIIPYDIEIDPANIRAKVIDTVKEEREGVKLEDAEVVIAGGRGIGNEESFSQLADLAVLLKGAVGASRPPCDSGWAPSTFQVGLTGKIVSPKLYIAVGISGALQHLTGCLGSKCIVAINKDPEANIFKNAHLGIIGDWKQIIPSFTETVKELI